MVKHTPGPWHVGHLGSDRNCQCRTVVDEGYAGGICTVHLGNGLPVGEGGNDAPPLKEAVANMHMIAAAPDLLEALKDARYALYGNGPGNPKIDAAIAKAEGRS